MDVDSDDNSNENAMGPEKEGGDNEEDSDNSESDGEDLELLAKEAELKVVANIYDYQSHIDLIEVLKAAADLDKLRVARNRMAEQFPLTPELWLSWLQDEVKLASTPEQKMQVKELFERAVKDYLSVSIWLEYVQFSIGAQDTDKPSCFDDVRVVFERALTAAGLHVPMGALLWEAYIEYEVLISKLLEAKGVQADVEAQLKRVGNLYKRQLSCPLLDMDDTMERFLKWLEDVQNGGEVLIDKAVVEHGFIKAKEKLHKISPFENAVLSQTGDKQLETYNEYLEHEKSKSGFPSRVQCLYERAVCEHCLQDFLWVEYINYVGNVLGNAEVTLDVCRRAIRNCPWSSSIHKAYLTYLEKFNRPHVDITAAMNVALSAGFQQVTDYQHMWMAYLEYLRRRSDDPDITKEEEDARLTELVAAFSRAVAYLAALPNSDPDYNVTQFWARIEAIYRKNMEKTRELWSDIVSDERHKTAAMWLEYIHLERAFGDSKHLRKLLPRALQNTWDAPDVIARTWLNYERDEGTLESYTNCVAKIDARMKQFREQRERQEAKLAAEQQQRKPRRGGLGYKEKGVAEKGMEPRRSIVGYKRKMQEGEDEVSPPKKATSAVVWQKGTKLEEDANQKQGEQSSEDIVQNLLKEKNAQDHGVTVKHDTSKDHRTVFISNLDYSTEEAVVREVLAECGAIADFRLVRDFKGRSKGFCYVEFQSETEVKKALEKDRHLIGSRPMFISRCDPDKETRPAGFKYSTRLEKNKLFVRGLPLTTTSEELRTIFGQFGTVKDVRVVTMRSGASKGLAYVDYEDDVSAGQAIMKLDGSTIGDRKIAVAISNPPTRNSDAFKAPVSSLGGGTREAGPRGRGRTQIAFLPRKLQLNAQTATRQQLADMSINSPSAGTSGETKKLSNADFRNILKS